MLFVWSKKYECSLGHKFRKYKIVGRKKVCPKCGVGELYKKG